MMSLTSHCQILFKHNIMVDMFCLKLTSHLISYLRLRLRRDIVMRNQFLQNKSYRGYIYITLNKIMLNI